MKIKVPAKIASRSHVHTPLPKGLNSLMVTTFAFVPLVIHSKPQ